MAKGAFSRMADVVRAEVDDVLTRLEDPKKMVRQMILDMESALEDAVAAVGRSMANEKMLERQISMKKETAGIWQEKAEAAMDAGDEALARKALFQKVAVDEAVAALEQALTEAREVSQQLRQYLAELKVKLADAHARQGALILRKAQMRGDVRTGIGHSEAFARYEDFCREVAREEATAQVYAEISGQASPELDDAFGRLEQTQRVEAEIQALKEKAKTSQS